MQFTLLLMSTNAENIFCATLWDCLERKVICTQIDTTFAAELLD